MKLLSIVGARPHFIKPAPESLALASTNTVDESVVQTDHHFDHDMSDVLFDQLGFRPPDVRLNIHGGSHGEER